MGRVKKQALYEQVKRATSEAKAKNRYETDYNIRPKSDIYGLSEDYGRYVFEKQKKGSSGSVNLSQSYTKAEMDIYLKGVNTGVLLAKKRL